MVLTWHNAYIGATVKVVLRNKTVDGTLVSLGSKRVSVKLEDGTVIKRRYNEVTFAKEK